MPLSSDSKRELYRKMLLVRAMEEMHLKLLREGRFRLMAHVGTGQEAVAVGVTAPLRTDDLLFGTHRGVGEYIGKGMSPKDIWLEYLGKRSGPCKGKGTLHLADRSHGIPGLVSCLGSDFSWAVGTALAAKMRAIDQVTLCFFGEGTCNQADFHPAMCMASLWKVPLVFALCTNQFCGMSPKSVHHPIEAIGSRAAGYGIPYQTVDGQDIEVTCRAAEEAIEHARSGKGPCLVEFVTCRMYRHFSGDPGGYIDQEQMEIWRQRDPIDLFQHRLREQGILSEEEDRTLRLEVQSHVAAVVEDAFNAPDPSAEDLFEDVFAQEGVKP